MGYDEFVFELSTKTPFLEENIVKFMTLTCMSHKETEEVLMTLSRAGVCNFKI